MERRTITTEFLAEHKACDSQSVLFSRIFPAGSEITLERLEAASRAGLALSWFARRVLTHEGLAAALEEMRPERDAYAEARVPALEKLRMDRKEGRDDLEAKREYTASIDRYTDAVDRAWPRAIWAAVQRHGIR